MSLRGAGVVAALVMSAVLWIYGHGHGAGGTTAGPAYCHDVDRLTQVLTTVRQGGATASELPAISSIDGSLAADATTEAKAGDTVAAAALTTLAENVGSWRTSIVTGDAVNQTIALDRILSDLANVPGC